MGNTSSRPLNPRAPREIYYDLGYGDIISNPLVAPAAADAPPKINGRRTFSFARKSTALSSRRVIGGYPKNYHCLGVLLQVKKVIQLDRVDFLSEGNVAILWQAD